MIPCRNIESALRSQVLSIAINNCSHVPDKEVKVAYQPFQTIPRENLTDEAIEKLATKTVKYINDAKTKPEVALKLMGIVNGSKRK